VDAHEKLTHNTFGKVQNPSVLFHLTHILVAIRSDAHHTEQSSLCGAGIAMWHYATKSTGWSIFGPRYHSRNQPSPR
jgi:hypothetical protein